MIYYTNETNESVGVFDANTHTAPPGWRESTQSEIDAYLLNQAKSLKVEELNESIDEFRSGGYEYSREIFCPAYASETSYTIHDLVLGSDSKNYESLQSDNQDNDPISSPTFWSEYKPIFKTNDKTMLNILVKCSLKVTAPDRYKFYTKKQTDETKHFIDFEDNTKWTNFVAEIQEEEDRVMKKYNAYGIQIAGCSKVAEVNAINIDFSV